MSEHAPTTGNDTPRRTGSRGLPPGGFAIEREHLSQADETLNNAEAQAPELRQALRDLRDAYESLLGQTAKLTRISDATQKRLLRAQEATQRAEQNYRGIFENSFEGIFQITVGGSFIDANPSFLALFGYQSLQELKTVTGDTFEALLAEPAQLPKLGPWVDCDSKLVNCEVQAYDREGALFWLNLNRRCVCATNGEILYIEGSEIGRAHV
mgnify:FL=1